jgi:ADP-ribose pyrophosphatase YjhB (NUDIX family)
MREIQAVGGIVYRINKTYTIDILLIKKARGDWSLPKGKLKSGESAPDALLREVREETGISGVIEDLVGEAAYQVRKSGGPRNKTVAYFLVRATEGTLRPDKQEGIEQVGWFALDQALQRLRRQRLQALVRAAQTLLGPVAATSQQ